MFGPNTHIISDLHDSFRRKAKDDLFSIKSLKENSFSIKENLSINSKQ